MHKVAVCGSGQTVCSYADRVLKVSGGMQRERGVTENELSFSSGKEVCAKCYAYGFCAVSSRGVRSFGTRRQEWDKGWRDASARGLKALCSAGKRRAIRRAE